MQIAVSLQLLNVVYQAIHQPLRVDFRPAAVTETVEPLVRVDVSEHRFNDTHALLVTVTAFGRVDLLLHAFDRVGIYIFVLQQRYLSSGLLRRTPHAT